MEFSSSLIRNIEGRDPGTSKPEWTRNEDGLWVIRDIYKGSREARDSWFVVATFNTEEEMKAWAIAYYTINPYGTASGGPKATPTPYWTDESSVRCSYLRGLERHKSVSNAGYSYYPEFRKNSGTGECTVYDVVDLNGNLCSAQPIIVHPSYEAAKIWAAKHYKFPSKSSGGTVTKYVPPLPPMKDADKKLLLLL